MLNLIIIIVIKKNRPIRSMWIGLSWVPVIGWVVLDFF